jgi:hypothetical protein
MDRDRPRLPDRPSTPPSASRPVPPAAPLEPIDVGATAVSAEELRRFKRRRLWLLVANIFLYALALEATIESLWRGTPLFWWLIGALLVYLGFTLFNWTVLQPSVRLFASILYILGLIDFAVFKLGASSDLGFWVATIALDRLMLIMVAASVLLTAHQLLRLRFVRRDRFLLGLIVAAIVYSLIPIGVAIAHRLPFEAAARGEGYWTWPPYWLQGVYIATQILIPIGFLAAICVASWAFLRARSHQTILPSIAALILLAAFAAASIELTRANIPNVSGTVYQHYWEMFHPNPGDVELKPGGIN